jgi:hypothetical protein
VTPIRAVLDTTAVIAYTLGSADLGEVITEIASEGAAVAVPVTCLLEAAQQADSGAFGLLDMLAAHAHSALLPLDTDRWRLHANAARLLGTLGRAQAAMCVIDGHASYVLTSEPDVYGEGIPTIAI